MNKYKIIHPDGRTVTTIFGDYISEYLFGDCAFGIYNNDKGLLAIVPIGLLIVIDNE